MSEHAGYDVIGDIHGHAAELESLLQRLEYVRRDGVWRHPERCAVFVGDLVDRGPENVRTCQIVMDMMAADSALAVMGNHEFNHITLATPDPDHPGEFLRPHTEKNLKQTAKTYAEFNKSSDLRDKALAWMRTLPLWLELPGLRVVHASWSENARHTLASCLDDRHALKPASLIAASQKGNPIHAARDTLLNGPERRLPNGLSFKDGEGHERHEARIRWWLLGGSDLSWRDALEVPDAATASKLPTSVFPQQGLPAIDRNSPPVIFGHYWMKKPLNVLTPLNPRHACVDASVARGGSLAAYRFSGEADLCDKHFAYA
jgi:hypothetical protein